MLTYNVLRVLLQSRVIINHFTVIKESNLNWDLWSWSYCNMLGILSSWFDPGFMIMKLLQHAWNTVELIWPGIYDHEAIATCSEFCRADLTRDLWSWSYCNVLGMLSSWFDPGFMIMKLLQRTWDVVELIWPGIYDHEAIATGCELLSWELYSVLHFFKLKLKLKAKIDFSSSNSCEE
jgi:hypothetical protein